MIGNRGRRRDKRAADGARRDAEVFWIAPLDSGVPEFFEATAEALAAGNRERVIPACWVAGQGLAEMGVSLAESLDRLRATTCAVVKRDPTYDEMHSLSLSWSESTLGYLHSLSCVDPATGLSTLAHVRHRLSELYRDTEPTRGHALVVAEAGRQVDPLTASRSMTLLGQAARTVFSGAETIGQAGPNRLVVVAERDPQLASRVSLLRRVADPTAQRVWIEGLPHTDTSAGLLLDELARGD